MLAPENLSTIQFAVFPVLLLAAAAASLQGRKIPRSFLAFALCGTVLSFAFSYCFTAHASQSVVVSALQGDTLQSQGRIFRQKINSYLVHRGPARAAAYYHVLPNYSSAAAFLREKGLQLLVWGNSHWLNISFPITSAHSVEEFGQSYDFSPLSKLRMITSVPNVGLSYEPRNETSDYVAGLTASLLPGHDPLAPMAPEDLGRRELLLMDTGNIAGKWTAGAHRALPWWILGNLYSYQVLRSKQIEPGEIHCAIDAYYRARSFLRANDKGNADLWSAIHNNLAVMTALQGLVLSKPKELRRARRLAMEAARIKHLPNVYHLDPRPGVVARENVHILKGYIQKKPHGKKKAKSAKKHKK
ncbi:MAG: hypothetical protein J0M12_04725 [Deltaproteobacteria bacterium]|nr:hypothetical protein [Deltaproteobacteria bacterium]